MYLSSRELQEISNYRPAPRTEDSLLRAAIAIILRDGDHGTEFLLMQRAFHKHDPWSGQMSFPGGKIEPDDASAKAAAEREAAEEVSIVLTEDDYIGQLDELYGLKVDDKFSVHVSSFVYKPQRAVTAAGNYEVADLVWLPMSWLEDPANSLQYTHPRVNNMKTPAVMIDADKGQVLWGLSLRMLSIMYEILGRELLGLSAEQQQELKRIEEQNLDSRKLDATSLKIMDSKVSHG